MWKIDMEIKKGLNMKKVKILIVEDEAIVAEDLEVTLTHAGYQVAGRSVSADDALKQAAALGPDLILMDIILKGKRNGIDASQDIKEKLNIGLEISIQKSQLKKMI